MPHQLGKFNTDFLTLFPIKVPGVPTAKQLSHRNKIFVGILISLPILVENELSFNPAHYKLFIHRYFTNSL